MKRIKLVQYKIKPEDCGKADYFFFKCLVTFGQKSKSKYKL